MKRTTIMLPADLKARAKQAARARGISFGEFLRRSLRTSLQQSEAVSYTDPVFADSAVFEGETPEDLVADHDRYLYGGRE